MAKYPSKEGVAYFGNDDNTYSQELFDEIRDAKKVSVWLVDRRGNIVVEKPGFDSVSGRSVDSVHILEVCNMHKLTKEVS